jgi:AcrR family transcriptional regulator
MTDLVYEVGYQDMTLTELLSHAHVAKRDFYRLFAGKEALFSSAYEEAVTNAVKFVGSNAPRPVTRADILGRGLEAFLEAISLRPADAYLGLLETISVGPAATERMRKTEEEIAGLVIRRLAAAEDPVVLPQDVAHGMVAGVGRLARERLKDRANPLTFDDDELVHWVLSVSDPALEGLAIAGVDGRVKPTRSRFAGDLQLPMADERALLIRAAIRVAAEEGYAGLSPRRIAQAAGVSKRTFDGEFASIEDCVSRALELGTVAIVAEIRTVFLAAPDWSNGICRAVDVLCGFLSSEPGLARLAFVEIFVPGRAVTRKGSAILSALARLLRDSAPIALQTGSVAAEASVGAIWSLLRKEVAAGRIGDLSRLAPTLGWLVLAPVIGGPRAIEVLAGGQIRRCDGHERS